MQILINNQSGVPIYEQIYSQIKAQIISCELISDTPLPSIRTLAKDLRISVITTKRAYEELECDGFIYTAQGRGSFVAAKNIELLKEENLRLIESHLENAILLASQCNLSREDIISMVNILFEEDN